jgi:hypothetical protein
VPGAQQQRTQSSHEEATSTTPAMQRQQQQHAAVGAAPAASVRSGATAVASANVRGTISSSTTTVPVLHLGLAGLPPPATSVAGAGGGSAGLASGSQAVTGAVSCSSTGNRITHHVVSGHGFGRGIRQPQGLRALSLSHLGLPRLSASVTYLAHLTRLDLSGNMELGATAQAAMAGGVPGLGGGVGVHGAGGGGAAGGGRSNRFASLLPALDAAEAGGGLAAPAPGFGELGVGGVGEQQVVAAGAALSVDVLPLELVRLTGLQVMLRVG